MVSKWGFTGAVAVMVVWSGLLAGNANAARLRFSGVESVTASGPVTFGERELGNTIICDKTLLRSFITDTDYPKILSTMIGRTTGIAIDRSTCRGTGAISAIEDISTLEGGAEPPCRVTGTIRLCVVRKQLLYQSFEGTLPSVQSLLIKIARVELLVRYRALGFRHGCLYEGEIPSRLELVRETGRAVGSIILLSITSMALVRTLEGFTCPSPLAIGANLSISQDVRLRLV